MANFRIKDLCNEKGITQKELALRMGITPVGLAKALGGSPNISTLEKIASALGVELVELFERSERNVIVCPKCGARIRITTELESTNEYETERT